MVQGAGVVVVVVGGGGGGGRGGGGRGLGGGRGHPLTTCKCRVTRWQNVMPSFPWIAPGWVGGRGRNPRKRKDQILHCNV